MQSLKIWCLRLENKIVLYILEKLLNRYFAKVVTMKKSLSNEVIWGSNLDHEDKISKQFKAIIDRRLKNSNNRQD